MGRDKEVEAKMWSSQFLEEPEREKNSSEELHIFKTSLTRIWPFRFFVPSVAVLYYKQTKALISQNISNK